MDFALGSNAEMTQPQLLAGLQLDSQNMQLIKMSFRTKGHDNAIPDSTFNGGGRNSTDLNFRNSARIFRFDV